MTVATFKTDCDLLVTAINAGDVKASDIKNNTSSVKASALALAIALCDMIAVAGLGARYQSGARVNNNTTSI